MPSTRSSGFWSPAPCSASAGSGAIVGGVAVNSAMGSADLASVGDRESTFPLPHGRDQIRDGGSSGSDPRELPPRGLKPSNIHDPYGHINQIKVKARYFR
ncbi:hypothetical protein NKI86_07060 [Mesorhizobium sp. M0320]|uniref:hypothetical protein n=1 Tax=Mesorhizobium sp. M0320 TaxID=2956936 RepID=UPI00333B5867